MSFNFDDHNWTGAQDCPFWTSAAAEKFCTIYSICACQCRRYYTSAGYTSVGPVFNALVHMHACMYGNMRYCTCHTGNVCHVLVQQWSWVAK